MEQQKFRLAVLETGDNILGYKAEICLVIAMLSVIYLIFNLLSLSTIAAITICLLSLCGFVCFIWQNIRKKKIINFFSPSTKKMLLQRSFMDIYRDLVYFPRITTIIGAFIRGAIVKPDPKQMHNFFDQLDPGFVKAINTKGILHLAPEKVQKLILQNDEGCINQIQLQHKNDQQKVEGNQNDKLSASLVPVSYGKIIPKWDNIQKYNESQVKVHEISLHESFMENMSDKIKWRHIVILCGMLGYALMKTKGKKMGKIFLYNGSAVGLIVVSLLIFIKYSKINSMKKKKKSIFEQMEIFSPRHSQ